MSLLFRQRSLVSRCSNLSFFLRPFASARPALSKLERVSENLQERQLPEHAVISTFDLFSIGVGPSSSHTVGPMRAGKIFITDLKELNVLAKVATVKINLYGSLAATGRLQLRSVHHTPQAILLGLEGSDPETIIPTTIESRYNNILTDKSLLLGGDHRIHYDMDRDMLWRWDQVLPTHPNGMRFSAFDEDGNLLATNEYYSVGGGFVVNEKTKVDENLFYKGVDKSVVPPARLHQMHSLTEPSLSSPSSEPSSGPFTPHDESISHDDASPPYPFESGNSLLALTQKHNMTIAQIVYDNEKSFGYLDEDIHQKILRIWSVMDECIQTGVTAKVPTLPGRLGLRRRAPILYRRLMRGFYPGVMSPPSNDPKIEAGSLPTAPSDLIDAPESKGENPVRFKQSPSFESFAGAGARSVNTANPSAKRAPRVVGAFDHPLLPEPPRKTMIPAVDFLSCYAIAVNEVNASGGRIVTSPTNGAAGVIPAVLKYIIEFISDDPEKSVMTFLLTASAIGMLFKRGSTISAAEGGCQAEVGVACSMAAGGFAACMVCCILIFMQINYNKHNLGLTCDPIDGLVQVPCISENSFLAVKAVTAAQLSLASHGVYSVTLDEAIEAMRLTASDMSVKYKETSLSTTVKIPLTVPAW
ncbi:serine dehydratase alpha chain-domain-containing protein [Lentinula aff. detonsa]|uniref:Serine dehydratase alpha chain-domain-containing protein n=1 Tax=Lentinula aff. detonsa TaxID=2804958 RepID=A0AA38L448_9AGAR|nr:serine dehydratase alpha chain-domain-containing protein [Lentinula aff. detonsa]